MNGDFEIVYFCGKYPVDLSEDLLDEYDGPKVFSDNYPKGYEGKTHFIELNESDDFVDRFREPLNDFMLYAHSHPKTKFILCDFVEALCLNKREKDNIAKLFSPIFGYSIKNIIVPSWIAINWVTYECISCD